MGWTETVQDVAIGTATVSGFLVAITAASKTPLVSRPGRWFLRHLVTEPLEAAAARLADQHIAPVVERLDTIDGRLEAVESEVRTNGGASLKDAVVETKDQIRKIAERQGTIHDEVLDLRRRVSS